MNHTNSTKVHDPSAAQYDRLAAEFSYVLPDALFGLCFDFLQPGQRLLDIGIGTGLSALPFAKLGLEIYGLDESQEMLKVCQSKEFTGELKQWDLTSSPWPYSTGFFDHLIACGVMHFVPALEPIFQEAARMLRVNGIFAFTIKSPLPGACKGMDQNTYITEIIEGVHIYSHCRSNLEPILAGCGFNRMKELKVLLRRGLVDQDDIYTLFIAQKSAQPGFV
jgi:predicted TPR repeat methyltransferase